jgi:hypothetical protein
MADYDEDGWRHPAYSGNADVSRIGKTSGDGE